MRDGLLLLVVPKDQLKDQDLEDPASEAWALQDPALDHHLEEEIVKSLSAGQCLSYSEPL